MLTCDVGQWTVILVFLKQTKILIENQKCLTTIVIRDHPFKGKGRGQESFGLLVV